MIPDTRKKFTLVQLAGVDLDSYRNVARARQALAGFDKSAAPEIPGKKLYLDFFLALGVQIAADLAGEAVPTYLLRDALHTLKRKYPTLQEKADKSDPDGFPLIFLVVRKDVSKRVVTDVTLIDFADDRMGFLSLASAGCGRIIMLNVYESAQRLNEKLRKIEGAEETEAEEVEVA